MYRIPNSAVAIVPETALESRANFVIAGIFHLKSVMEILNIKNPADIGPNCSMLSNVNSPPVAIARNCHSGTPPLHVSADRLLDRFYRERASYAEPLSTSPGNRIGFRKPQ